MIVLDTNVVSEPTKQHGDERVLKWLDRQPREDLFLASISLAELNKGAALTPDGKRKAMIENAIRELTTKFLLNPILPFDVSAANAHKDIILRARAKRYTLSVADGFIAAIALAHGCAVATRDVDPFLAAGLHVINPWKE